MKNIILVSLAILMSVNTLVAQNTAYDLYASGLATEVAPIKKDIKETWFPLFECSDNTDVSHVIAYVYGLMSIINAGAFVTTDPALYSYSPYFIHNQLRNTCNEDITIHEGLNVLKMRGIALKKDFPATKDCSSKPDETTRKIAAKNRIKDHLCILDEHTAPDDKVLAVQKQLYKNNNPVIVQLTVNQHIEHIPIGTHALCIVGYDNNRDAFELLGSRSKTWTDSGYLWLSYKDFGQMTTVGYIMAPGDGTLPPVEQEPLVVIENKPTRKEQPTPSPVKVDEIQPKSAVARNAVNLHGTFELRFVKQYEKSTGDPVFVPAKPTLNNNIYTLSNWKTEDVYQLIGTTMKAYSYTYVFSVDAKNKTEVHFPPLGIKLLPHDELMTADNVPLKKIATKNTMVPDETAYMVIPDEESALQSVHAGTDYICVIYSHNKLDDFSERIVRVHEASHQDFQQRLNEGFSDILIPQQDIQYTDDLMSFKAQSDKGTAVPVILEVLID